MAALPTQILPRDFEVWQHLFLQSLPLGSTGSAGSSRRVFLVFSVPLVLLSGCVRCSADALREVSSGAQNMCRQNWRVLHLEEGLAVHLNRQT